MCTKLKAELTLLQDSVGALDTQISTIPNELIDIAKVREDKTNKNFKIEMLAEKIREQSKKIDKKIAND